MAFPVVMAENSFLCGIKDCGLFSSMDKIIMDTVGDFVMVIASPQGITTTNKMNTPQDLLLLEEMICTRMHEMGSQELTASQIAEEIRRNCAGIEYTAEEIAAAVSASARNYERNEAENRGLPLTLAELYSHPNFVPFGSSSDDWINDRERMERCHEAAENGADGSTHYEVMSDWRECLARQFRGQDLDMVRDLIDAEIDACEAWHDAAGSLHKQIG